VVVLDKLPVLGTGKIDMVGVAKLVTERRRRCLRASRWWRELRTVGRISVSVIRRSAVRRRITLR